MELSETILFTTKAEAKQQEQFEAELCQMESDAWAKYQRQLDAALADFMVDRDMKRFQERHGDAEVAYQKRREEWWKARITEPAPAQGQE